MPVGYLIQRLPTNESIDRVSSIPTHRLVLLVDWHLISGNVRGLGLQLSFGFLGFALN